MKRFTLLKKLLVALMGMALLTPMKSYAGWDDKTAINTFTPGTWGAQLVIVNGKIYAGGGYHGNNNNSNDWQEYDPSTDAWAFKNDMPGNVANRSGGVTFTINGKAYLGMGIENFNNFTASWNFLNDLWEYDEANDTWTQKADFPGMGGGFCGVFVIENKAYVIGGTTGKLNADGSNQLYEYDPAADTWTQKADFPAQYIKDQPFAFAANGKGYISCGQTDAGISDKTYEYDPAADTWTEKAAFAGGAVSSGVTFMANGVPYCGLGGQGGTDYPTVFYTYNADSDSWSYAGGFEFSNLGRKYAKAATIGNKVYMGMGWRIDGGPNNQTWYKDWYEIDAAVSASVPAYAQSKVAVYPNPATNLINIDIKNEGQYRIYGTTGRLLQSGTVNAEPINIEALTHGTYILKIISESSATTHKIIKE